MGLAESPSDSDVGGTGRRFTVTRGWKEKANRKSVYVYMCAFLLKGWNRGRISYANDIFSLSCCSPSVELIEMPCKTRQANSSHRCQRGLHPLRGNLKFVATRSPAGCCRNVGV